MRLTVPDLSLAGQDEWSIESIVDYYCMLQFAEISNAQEEGRVPKDRIKLSRRMTAYLKQAVEQEINKAYAGTHAIVWAGPELETLIQPQPWGRTNRSYPYLMLASVILHRSGIETPDDYGDSDHCWYKEAFEALASGVGMPTEFKDHWFGPDSGYYYFNS